MIRIIFVASLITFCNANPEIVKQRILNEINKVDLNKFVDEPTNLIKSNSVSIITKGPKLINTTYNEVYQKSKEYLPSTFEYQNFIGELIFNNVSGYTDLNITHGIYNEFIGICAKDTYSNFMDVSCVYSKVYLETVDPIKYNQISTLNNWTAYQVYLQMNYWVNN